MGSQLYLFMSFLCLSLYRLQFSSCFTIPGKPLSSAGVGQQLGSIGPFLNNVNNATLLPILVSDNYMSMASLSRGQAYRYDTNTIQNYCNINLQYPLGVWVWTTPCEPIPTSDTCSAALSSDGDLQILDGAKVLWRSGTAGQGVEYVELTDSGELELLNANNATVWKSSDHVIRDAVDFCNVSTSGSAPGASTPSSATMVSPSSWSAPGVVAGGPGEGPAAGHAPHSSASVLYISITAGLLFSAASAPALPLLYLA